ncbi:hypothetical protein GGR34_000774 [Microvirga flocculans]|uniref:DUF2815 family protein n=1 Tax=Microvirga flocculans TaxID=217168 RepID=A0A7W6ID04_9HYPH|nr:hypothetical protein [Microvirga flocculans]MBB4039139.1 hypothetical protein [Microvirga flocculans]
MADKKEYVSFITPLGRARYPKLDKQDTYEGKEVGYKCDLVLDDADMAKVQKIIDDAVKQLAPGGKLKNGKKTPIREDEEGNKFLTFKSYNKVPLFKAKGKDKYPEDTILGGGSLIRMKVSLTIGNGHLVGYMNAIQVAELKQGSDGGFDDLEGFDNDDDDSFGDEGDGDLDI